MVSLVVCMGLGDGVAVGSVVVLGEVLTVLDWLEEVVSVVSCSVPVVAAT